MTKAEEREKQEARDREDKRIANQRNLFTFLPPGPSAERLKAGMLQRAYDLLWDGRAEECDAILEFLPSRDVDEMLSAWLDDQDDKTTSTSRWYEGLTNG